MDQANTLRNALNEQNIRKEFSSRVITVTSGKGGVGKSNFTLNLAVCLVSRGLKVIIFDADFGLANIEILSGVSPQHTFADVMNGRKTIEEVITEGPGGVDFISGGSGIVDFIRSGDAKINFILDNFSVLDKIYDIILVDTAAGVSDNVLNFVRASSEAIVVTTPEPTSLTDAYALLKSVKYISKETELPNFHIIVNRIDELKEGHEVFNKLLSVCGNFLKLNLNLLGFIPNDSQLPKAVKKQQAAVLFAPKSAFTRAVGDIADSLVSKSVVIRGTTGIATFMKRLVRMFNG